MCKFWQASAGLPVRQGACKNWRTGPAKLAQLGWAEAIGQCKSELRSLFAPKRALLFCYFCPRVNRNNIPKYVYLFWVANSQTLFENRILDLKYCLVKYENVVILLFDFQILILCIAKIKTLQ